MRKVVQLQNSFVPFRIDCVVASKHDPHGIIDNSGVVERLYKTNPNVSTKCPKKKN